MKKIFSILYTAFAVSLISCGGAGGKGTDTDTIKNATEPATTVTIWNLTEKGISSIVLGMSASEIPDSIPGLYDHVDTYEGKSFIGYSFVRDSTETFNAEDTDFDGKINLITLRDSSPLKAVADNVTLYIGMPESELLKPEGDKHIDRTKEVGGGYHVGPLKIHVQDGKISEIYIEWSPSRSK